jgi:thiol-disulfide isomerase/thioredoxin
MNLLETQEQFEIMWFSQHQNEPPYGVRISDRHFIVYFTASWCKPCQLLDLEKIIEAANEKDLPIWKCDDTINNYTCGYCGVRKLPTFICMKPKTIISTLQSNDTEKVKEWIYNLP